MGLFTKQFGTIFLKETGDSEQQIKQLTELLPQADNETKKQIEHQIKLCQYGKYGEEQVAYALKYSGMDMFILHDIYLKYQELSAQIDYIVLTRKHIYIIECKNLIGDIEIDQNGNFIRSYELSGKPIREGIESPITQNNRHLEVIRKIRQEEKKNLLSQIAFKWFFLDNYCPIVVLANPKTILHNHCAKKKITEQVLRVDQLVEYIKTKDLNSKDISESSEKELRKLAEFFLQKNCPKRFDYTKKYKTILQQTQFTLNSPKSVSKKRTNSQKPKDTREELIRQLKAFRLETSRREQIKPYMIFNDAQMNDLIDKNPSTKQDLLQVSGFGKIKVKKYGEAILNILTCFDSYSKHSKSI